MTRYSRRHARHKEAAALPLMGAAAWTTVRGAGRTQLTGGVGYSHRWMATMSLLMFILALLSPSAFGGVPSDLEAQVREITFQLRCPVCQGLSVGDSPSELANEMRTLVREQLQQGKTTPEVLDYFAQRYGEWILLAPPKRGFNLVIWVLPFTLLPIGAMVIFLGVRHWVRNPSARELPAQPPDPAYAERLQRELDSYQ